MLDTLKKNVRQALAALRRIEARGHSRGPALLLHLPDALVRRGYGVLARRLHHMRLVHAVNRGAFRAFQRDHAPVGGGNFYLIVMPGTLHFVIPCLALLPSHLRVILIANGAAKWERQHLARAFPRYPIFKLRTLPGASVAHGDVLTLLLAATEDAFGILDHDCYVFDASIFDQLAFGERDCLVAIFGNTSARVAITYPETYFLYFEAKALRSIMDRYGVDASAYRNLPPATRNALAAIGVRDGSYLKDYHDYFDTLHVLFLLALAEGFGLRFLQSIHPDSIAHVGSTSSGVAHTKDLMHSYVQLLFLELLDDASVRRRYRGRTHPFRTSSEVRSRIPRTPEAVARMELVEALIARLAARVPHV